MTDTKTRHTPGPFQVACSVRGDSVHAWRAGFQETLCGVTNYLATPEGFDPDYAFACPRCVKHVLTLLDAKAKEEK